MTGGVFNLRINDELVFSKKAIGRHAEPGEIRAIIAEHVTQAKQKHGITWDEFPEED